MLIIRGAAAILVAVLCAVYCIAEDAVEFPMAHYDGVIMVPVTVGGDDHLFMLDSGASQNVCHTDLRPFLRSHREKQTATDAAGKQFSVEIFDEFDGRVANFEVDPIGWTDSGVD